MKIFSRSSAEESAGTVSVTSPLFEGETKDASKLQLPTTRSSTWPDCQVIILTLLDLFSQQKHICKMIYFAKYNPGLDTSHKITAFFMEPIIGRGRLFDKIRR